MAMDGLAGLFLGPQMVGEALKGGRLVARVMEGECYRVHPPAGSLACPSFITAVEVGSRERMIAFCKAVQRASPVGSYIEPTPGDLSLTIDECWQCMMKTESGPADLQCTFMCAATSSQKGC